MVILHLDDAIIKSLSSSELDVLKFIYENSQEVSQMSIHDFSNAISYSSATILRFCKKLGFSGYAEFKYALRSELKKEEHSPINKKEPLTSQTILKDIYSDIEGTSNLVQDESLENLFKILDSSNPIYLWAPGGITSILTEYLEKQLFIIGRQNVYKIESAKMGEHILRNDDKNSILFLISTSGDFAPTVKMAKLANMNAMPLITITPYTNNIIANLATINFRFFTHQRENEGAEFTSRLPVFYVIHLLIQSYLEYKEKGK